VSRDVQETIGHGVKREHADVGTREYSHGAAIFARRMEPQRDSSPIIERNAFSLPAMFLSRIGGFIEDGRNLGE
jgi:hypothetical protein